MGTPKKKYWIVTCEVDMCAEREVKVMVRALKEHQAKRIAELECLRQGHFYASAYHCKEME